MNSISRKLTLGDPDVVTGPIPDKTVGLHGPYHYPNPPGHDYVPTIKDKYIFSKNNNSTFQRPANYTGQVLAQSSTPPAASVVRSFVFGMKQNDPSCQTVSSTGLMSGPAAGVASEAAGDAANSDPTDPELAELVAKGAAEKRPPPNKLPVLLLLLLVLEKY